MKHSLQRPQTRTHPLTAFTVKSKDAAHILQKHSTQVPNFSYILK